MGYPFSAVRRSPRAVRMTWGGLWLAACGVAVLESVYGLRGLSVVVFMPTRITVACSCG
ncbi:MAG: hypothetical protein P8R54_26350 [Myxococcota bacterium]|nr:hypothetical protein [Myxococcota bacterium]